MQGRGALTAPDGELPLGSFNNRKRQDAMN